MTLLTNLEARWSWNSVQTDSTGNWHTGSGISAYVTGLVYANAFSLTGGTVKFSTYAPAINTSDFCIWCWYKTTWNTGIFFSNNNWGNYLQLALSGWTLWFDIFANTCSVSNATVYDWNWHLLIAERSGSSMNIYFDNSSIASFGSVTNSAWSDTLVFGGRPFDNSGIQTSTQWPCFYYSRALSGAEKTSLYNSWAWLAYPFWLWWPINPWAFLEFMPM